MIPVSVIIPTYNRSPTLRRALSSVINQSFPCGDYEILVADNASTDNTRAVVEKVIKENPEHKIQYFYEPIPGSLSGRHRGAAESTGAILVFTDDDIEADPGWLSAIYDAFKDPAVHMVGGRNLPTFEAALPSWIEYVWEQGPIGSRLYSGVYSLTDFGDQRHDMDACHVWSLNLSIRRETFYQIGGFHPCVLPRSHQRFQGDGETGLALKLKARALKAVYEPRALLHHLVSADRLTMEYVERRYYMQGISDSFTSIRETQKYGLICYAPEFPATARERYKYCIENAHACGYNFHQNEVRKDPRLMSWVLRENFFDYRYPE